MTAFAIETQDGWHVGPFRQPTNNSRDETGTIHNDATARDLGFRAGTIAGSIHMEQFLPLCEFAFGPDWQRCGSLSLYFTNPTVDGEPVRASISTTEVNIAGVRHRQLAMATSAGLPVLEGSAAIGGKDVHSVVHNRLARMNAMSAQKPRILANVRTGFEATGLPTMVMQEDVSARLSIITEQRPEFSDAARFGHAVAPLSAAVHAMRVFESTLPVHPASFVGMFGAIDWQFINGPVMVDYLYLVNGQVVAIGESPKTELLWYQCHLCDPATGKDVARMLMLSRVLKDSSALWTDVAQSGR